MPIRVKEDWSGDALSYGSGGSEGLNFNIHGAASKFEAWNALADYTPPVYLGLVRSNIEVSQVGPTFFKGSVKYATVGPGGGETAVGQTPPESYTPPTSEAEPMGSGYSFNFAAETTHKTQSLKTRYLRAVGDPLTEIGSAPSYGGAVGVEISGTSVRVQGYDSPTLSQTWTRTVAVNPMTLGYRNAIRNLIGHKNHAPFYSSAAGETVLYGVSGQHVDGFKYSLTFTFQERPNITNLILRPDPDDLDEPHNPEAPGALVIPHASGWDHIWVIYEEDVDIDSYELLKKPKYAFVEQIIKDGNFAALRLGT
jgi:hypothetical protein